MIRFLLSIYTYLEFFLCTLALVPAFVWVSLVHRRDPTCRRRGRMIRRLGRWSARLTPFWKFSVSGDSPADIHQRGYVVISNHESTADPFLLASLPWDMRWVGKEELFRLPFLGWIMRMAGDIPLRRGNRESVERMLAECRKTLAHGMPVMLFPEGTRSPDGALLPFKDGAFRLAVETGAPMLLLVLAGTRQCRAKGSLGFGFARAQVRVLGEIETAGLGPSDVPALVDQARDRIQEGVRALRHELNLAVPEPLAAPIEGASDASA